MDTSVVLQTRLFLARLDSLDARQRSELWDQVVTRVARMKASRLDYQCRSVADDRITTRMSWENIKTETPANGAQWQVVYHVPREQGLMVTLEARGEVVGNVDPPAVDALFRLFAKVSLELPTTDAVPVPVDYSYETGTLPFPAPLVPEPMRHAA